MSLPRPLNGFVPLPTMILLDHRLSRGARLLYAILKRHARQRSICWPGYSSLCRDLGACEDTVRLWMRHLIDAGLVRQQRRGQGRTNLYVLTTPEIPAPHGETASPEPEFRRDQDAEECGGEEEREEEKQGGEVEKCGESSTDIPNDESCKGRKPIAPFRNQDPDRDRIRLLIADISRQLNDRAPLSSTTARLLAVMRRAGISFDQFAGAIYEARTRTLRRANIRDRDERGVCCRMAYFCSTLEDILGVRQQEIEGTRLTTDEDREVFGLAAAPHGDDNPPTLAADEGGMKRASPSRPWPVELIEMNIPDVPTYIRVCKRGRFDDDAESIAYAQRQLQRSR